MIDSGDFPTPGAYPAGEPRPEEHSGRLLTQHAATFKVDCYEEADLPRNMGEFANDISLDASTVRKRERDIERFLTFLAISKLSLPVPAIT